MDRKIKQTRSLQTELKTRAEPDGQDDMCIEGYFAVFGQETELWPGAFEEIAPGAFDNTLGNDIRALINHDTTFVLGRNKAGTLELKADSHGLWGRVKINPNDTDAVNVYERVKRGDVDQCSFGFNILQEKRTGGMMEPSSGSFAKLTCTRCLFAPSRLMKKLGYKPGKPKLSNIMRGSWNRGKTNLRRG